MQIKRAVISVRPDDVDGAGFLMVTIMIPISLDCRLILLSEDPHSQCISITMIIITSWACWTNSISINHATTHSR